MLICQICRNKFKTKASLAQHHLSAQYCIDMRSEMNIYRKDYKLIKKMKRGLGSEKVIYVEWKGIKMVLKYFRTWNKYDNELELYYMLIDEPFVPKVLYYSSGNNKKIGLTYVGESLQEKYSVPERKQFKKRIQKIMRLLKRKYGIYHNDLRWKNITELNGRLYLIDWERWDYVNKERDPERILT